MFFKIKSEMIFLKNLTAVLTRVQNLTTMLVTTVLHRTVSTIFLNITPKSIILRNLTRGSSYLKFADLRSNVTTILRSTSY